MTMSTFEKKQYPLRIEQFGEEGWYFVACDEIPGLASFCPNLDDAFKGLEEAAANLLRRRGRDVLSVTVQPSAEPADEIRPLPTWGPIKESPRCLVEA